MRSASRMAFSRLSIFCRAYRRAQQDVVTTVLKNRADHRLHAAARNHLPPRPLRRDPTGLQLELAEARGQEPRVLPPAPPGDASILAAVGRGDLARHMDAVEGDAVRLGLDAQESAEELVKLFGAEAFEILARHLEGRGGPGDRRRTFVPPQHPNRFAIFLQHAEKVAHRRPRPHDPRLVLGERPRPTPEERSCLLLGEPQPLADRPDPVGGHVLLRVRDRHEYASSVP